MTPRPFYRSRLFWLGLPGLVFLLWAWWLSTGHYSGAGFGGGNNWVIGQMGGEVFAQWVSTSGPDWGEFGVEHREMTGEDAQDVKEMFVFMNGCSPAFRAIFIPYYWPVIAYTATWLFSLALWQRRKSRRLKLHAAP